MKILVVGLNYAPEHSGIAPYTSGLATGLHLRHHSVRVVTGVPHYPAWSNFTGFTGWRRREAVNGVPVIRRRHVIADGGRGMSRVAMELTFGGASVTEPWDQPDVVVCVSPALFATAAVVARARLQHVPVVVWVQDLYGAGARELGAHPAVSSILPRVERAVLRSADAVAVIHERFRSHVVDELGVPADRVSVVRNWSHHTAPAASDTGTGTRDELGWAGRVVALHTGNMGAKQDLQNLVEAGREAERRGSDVLFVLVGDGSQRGALTQLADGCPNVRILAPVDEAVYVDMLAAADVLLVNEHPGLVATSVPSKLTSYLRSGRPVLAATGSDSATAAEIRLSGAGIVTAPGEPATLLDATVALAADPEQCRLMGERGSGFADQHLSETAGVAAFEELLARVVASDPDAPPAAPSIPLAVVHRR